MSRPRVLLDCDPGIDDAFAIFCAIRYAHLAAITTVSGNVDIDNTTRNARFLLELAGVDVPVHRGASRPLEVEAEFASKVHGTHGLGPLDVPEASIAEAETPADELIVQLAREAPLAVVAVGPLTNVARALRRDPEIAGSIERIWWMGGAVGRGNVQPRAEFNCWADPHAAQECLDAAVPFTMFGLNLTRQVRMSAVHRDRLTTTGSPTSVRAAELLEYYEAHGARDGLGQPMHDPCAVLGVTHPHLFTYESAHMVVVTSGADRGRTIVSSTAGSAMTPVTLAVTAAADSVIDLVLAAAEKPRSNE